MSQPEKIFVTDFDGTMTRHDFYALAIESLIPKDVPNYWADYRAGRVTHHEGLRRYFSEIRATEKEVLAVVERMELAPRLSDVVAALRQAGWQVIVASAGCQWYIEHLLSAAGVELEVYANPGRFVEGRGLIMDMPPPSPFRSVTVGVDKAAIVKHHLDEGRQVCFAGDGFPDAEAARLVPAELRFARDDLADVLRSEQLEFQPFEGWSDIVSQLTSENS